MEDAKKPKQKPNESEATVGKRPSETYTLEDMTDFINRMTLAAKAFEKIAKSMGYVSARDLREKQRRRENRQIDKLAKLFVRAIYLAILYRNSRSPRDKNSRPPDK